MVHRTKSRRFTVCAAAAVLLLAWYVASPPFVFPVAETFVPKAMPGLRVIYGPVEAYAVNQDLPGSKLYGTYIGRTVPVVKNALNPINPHATLLEPTQVEFRQTPLRDVLSYMSEIHGVELELDASADGTRRVSVASTGTVQMVLREMLEPQGLIAVPTRDRIVVSTQQVFDQQQAQAEASVAARTWTIRTVIAGLSAITILAVWLYWRSARTPDSLR